MTLIVSTKVKVPGYVFGVGLLSVAVAVAMMMVLVETALAKQPKPRNSSALQTGRFNGQHCLEGNKGSVHSGADWLRQLGAACSLHVCPLGQHPACLALVEQVVS